MNAVRPANAAPASPLTTRRVLVGIALAIAGLGSVFYPPAFYVVILAVCAVPLLFWLGRGAPFGHETVGRVLLLDPVAAALQASDAPGFADYDLLPANWWFVGAACVALLAFLQYRTWRLFRTDEEG